MMGAELDLGDIDKGSEPVYGERPKAMEIAMETDDGEATYIDSPRSEGSEVNFISGIVEI